jgi:hypothetical protein
MKRQMALPSSSGLVPEIVDRLRVLGRSVRRGAIRAVAIVAMLVAYGVASIGTIGAWSAFPAPRCWERPRRPRPGDGGGGGAIATAGIAAAATTGAGRGDAGVGGGAAPPSTSACSGAL